MNEKHEMDRLNRRTALARLAGSAVMLPAVASLACRSEPKSAKPDKKAEATPPKDKTESAKPAKKAEAAQAAEKAEAAPSGANTNVELKVGDNLAYSTNRIEVKQGSTVSLTITHTGKLPKSAMGHNFVLLEQGVDMAAFATAAMTAADTEYVPASMKDKVLAYTKVVGGGESDTIEFAAPPPGEYTYLCTFPGHYTQMNGKLIVS